MENNLELNENLNNKVKNENVVSTDAKKLALEAKKKAKQAFKNKTDKKVSSEKTAPKKDVNLTKLNFEKFSKETQKFSTEISASGQRKATIYIYPVEWTIIEIERQGKKFRKDRRNELMTFISRIMHCYSNKKTAELINNIKEFKIWYKRYFRINDFSLGSLTQTTGEKNKLIENFLNVVKDIEAQISKKK